MSDLERGPETGWTRECLEIEYRKLKARFRQLLETYECRRPMPDDPEMVCAMPKGHADACGRCVRNLAPMRVVVGAPPPGDCPACGWPRVEATCDICGCDDEAGPAGPRGA